jgi:exopolyphosphatase/guanosine-5'-triphosphate,3'-diphosphate pyrophosphatase
MQGRFGVDREQARAVGELAGRLFAALRPKADPSTSQRLQWAAALHEIGFAISHGEYHKHGAYLAEHSDMPGFSHTDQEELAALILAQRGNLKKVGALLTDAEHACLILALRLAVLLCHARRPTTLGRWSLKSGRASFELTVDRDWLARHPLSEHLLEEECAHWQRVGQRLVVKTE